ncbi:TPA: 50S ribosomal protein L30e [Candidatus Woesearchaeota archaeon]|nr:50S ribosomal protein L30e [Candidatus Woesearchaeota archaeon]
MAKKVEIGKEVTEIKKAIEVGKIVIGTQRTLKSLKLGRLKKIFLANNCPQRTKDDIEYYSKIANVEVVNLEEPNEELGTICKKQFSISVLSIPKEE